MIYDFVYNSSGEVIGRIRRVTQMSAIVGGEMRIEFECETVGAEMIEAFNRERLLAKSEKYEIPPIPKMSTGIGK